MAWYDEAVFYHIYPLGLTGAPKQNAYEEPVHRLNTLLPWIEHIKGIGCNAIYIGPLFESVGHGYETTDYKKLDSRLGTNEDLTNFVAECHKQGIRVILDGVFNHTGRDFFAFQDIKKNRDNSQYKDWYCDVNFSGNNSYNDGFSYTNWGGYDLLIKLNQKNPAVMEYICDVIRFWVSEFDIDGIRLDAADVMDFDYMKALRNVANEVKPEFWLMGEVIHGDYSKWANDGTLHSVTNYMLHKALYSAHNDHNYFEIAHTINYVKDMVGNNLKLYTFVDNHDVERIYTKLTNKAHFAPVHIMLYTLPGIPSLYYGSEFGIEGRKEQYSDDSLRPALNYEDYKDSIQTNPCTQLIATLGRLRQNIKALCYGEYRQLELQNTCFAYARIWEGKSVITSVNNGDNDVSLNLEAGSMGQGGEQRYVGALTGQTVTVNNGRIQVNVPANSGEIWIPEELMGEMAEQMKAEEVSAKKKEATVKKEASDKKNASEKKESSEKKEAPEKKVSGIKKMFGRKKAAPDKVVEPEKEAVLKEPVTPTKPEAPAEEATPTKPVEPVEAATPTQEAVSDNKAGGFLDNVVVDYTKSYEEMTVEELQKAILEKMRNNGPVTDYMLGTVKENTHHDSLVNWVKSFR
ncbi:MAG: alpha-amylase family glycosyl hydrolase [Agathobacter sp.]|nr:alpha-amylase family glycosyl hydrolase [Agathobacter sp.]